MKFSARTPKRRGLVFVLAVIAMLYVLTSAAIAWNTVDKCGDEDSPKTWSFFPPEWECERSPYISN